MKTLIKDLFTDRLKVLDRVQFHPLMLEWREIHSSGKRLSLPKWYGSLMTIEMYGIDMLRMYSSNCPKMSLGKGSKTAYVRRNYTFNNIAIL